MKNLSGGRKAVGFFNHGAADVTMSTTFANLGVSGPQRVRDVWRRADFAVTNGTVTANVPFRGAILFVLTPDVPDAGPDGVIEASSPPVEASSPPSEAGGGVIDASVPVDVGVAAIPDASTSSPSDAAAPPVEAGNGTPPGADASTGTPSTPSEPAKSSCSCRVGATTARPGTMWLGLALFLLARRRTAIAAPEVDILPRAGPVAR